MELDWVVADEEYGRAGHFLDELESLEQRYVVEVPVTTAVWTADPASCVPAYSGRGRVPTAPARDAVRTVAALAAELPASAWQRLQVREGATGPLVFEFAAVRVWAMRHRKPGPPAWLLIRRSLEDKPEVKYYVSNADAETPLATLALVACTRCRVEEFFEDCKSYLGHGAVRDAVVGRLAPPHDAGGSGASVRDVDAEAASKKVPELTLDRTVRLLEAALEEPELRLPRATALVEYHMRRNKVARSHMPRPGGRNTEASNICGCRSSRVAGSSDTSPLPDYSRPVKAYMDPGSDPPTRDSPTAPPPCS